MSGTDYFGTAAGSVRLPRMRGVPLANEALRFIESVRSQVAFKSEEIPDGEFPQPTGRRS